MRGGRRARYRRWGPGVTASRFSVRRGESPAGAAEQRSLSRSPARCRRGAFVRWRRASPVFPPPPRPAVSQPVKMAGPTPASPPRVTGPPGETAGARCGTAPRQPGPLRGRVSPPPSRGLPHAWEREGWQRCCCFLIPRCQYAAVYTHPGVGRTRKT